MKIKNTTYATGAMIAVAGLALAGCAGGSTPGGGGESGGSDSSVYLVSSVGTGFQDAYNAAFVATMEEAGVDVTLLQDPFDVNQNVQNLDRAISAKPSAIAVMSINDTAIIPSLERAKQAGVPVFYLDGRPVDEASDLLTSVLQTDNFSQGRAAAENIVTGLEGQGKTEGKIIALTGTAATNTVQDRMDGFREVLEENPGFELVAEEDANWDQTKSATLAQQLFAKYESDGGVQGAFGMADNQALGIVQAAKQAGLTVGGADGLIVSGSNCYAGGIESIMAGEMFGTASQAPSEEAAWAADLILQFLDGATLDAVNTHEIEAITAENAEAWVEPCTF